MPGDLTRRRLLKASAATAVGLGGIGTASASDTGDDLDARRAPCLDLTGVDMQTRPVEQYGVPETASGIRPGSQMFIEFPDGSTSGCTANFIWSSGGNYYIGAAGHCFLPSDAAASENAATSQEKNDGESFDTSQLGTVSVCADCTFGGLTGLSVVSGAVYELGDVVYARQENPNGEDGPGHDFGLVRIPSGKEQYIDASMPQWGGPNGVSADALPSGTPVNQYGAGIVNGEIYPTMGSSGVSLGGNEAGDTWLAALRATPGDSGSPLIGAETTGKPAAGILTHLTTTGVAGTTIQQCKAMVSRDVGMSIGVVQP